MFLPTLNFQYSDIDSFTTKTFPVTQQIDVPLP